VTSDPVDDATLALLLEVAGTPKPGNVDRHRDLDDLRFEAFLGGAVGAREGLELAADGETGIGRAFERGVSGMAARAGTNTQFGCLLLLVPLVRASVGDDEDDANLFPASVDRVTRETTVDDAVAFYRAFDHVDVAVGDPPTDADALDVRRGSDATPALREREVTLRDVMALSAEPADPDHADDPDRIPDRNAQEWAEGFPRTFRAAEWIQSDEGPMTDRAARAFLGLLAAESDTLIAANHGPETAREASERAGALLGGDRSTSGNIDATAVHDADRDAAEELAAAFVDEGINPGTTADLTCAALYVALRHGTVVSP
jgi:triphosphoribosyl-dephospho-CoA synthase